MLKGKHINSKYVKHVRTDKFTIITDNEIVGNLDGEELTSKKFEMSVIPKSLTFYHNKKLLEQINKELGR